MAGSKKFNTTGTCIPSLHYMADTTGMLNQIIDQYIEQGEFPDRASAWTREGFQAAVKLLLQESNTLFDGVRKKLDEFPKLSEMIYALLFTGKSIAYSPDYPFLPKGSGYSLNGKKIEHIGFHFYML